MPIVYTPRDIFSGDGSGTKDGDLYLFEGADPSTIYRAGNFIDAGESRQFYPHVRAARAPENKSVFWRIHRGTRIATVDDDCGSVTEDGLYTAPPTLYRRERHWVSASGAGSCLVLAVSIDEKSMAPPGYGIHGKPHAIIHVKFKGTD